MPLSFSISMGVKKGNRDLKNHLEAAIDHRQTEIRAILEEYGVPLVAAQQAAGGGRSAYARRHRRRAPGASGRHAGADASTPPSKN